ncbi:acetyl-CoA carboxylase carboxyltransferase subunit alpha [Catenisphaera adipataccumulans]|jgi:acetyl-CoA carboxylase carboxyl transferase subunit alpha|uniref:Acetyl-coenzyme A carboxylase carboxyl transferase subunit alpha n=1 Tax=Catenisphaera adipataccumulans TaxID=700500 RepID=J7MDH0_9FIRM|nr:acetyl-CoA carboxylase carboxyltransferase subunit alpha [Catenisphaera adipataccumulans]MBB5182362.1 acetyl-CoA carboxylase carboxyl transferase subunit alpha [Catenisphaera adipataccumulans]BAM37969.1 acetyl-CoA carboxylase [Catenisphaera adipataccumulans]
MSERTAWQRVKIARDAKRPKARDYIEYIFTDFMELHGDRCYGDDPAMLGGLAWLGRRPVTVLAQSKGTTLDENMARHFGMVEPEGYRKALRLAAQAEKFHRPIITFVDTPGAYPGKGAEERGQAQAIAECLYQFSDITVPVICVVLSEGGSGGALALSVANHLMMLENAVYSILSPEGFASILWKDESRVEEAAEAMKITAADLKEAGIIDEIISEPEGGAQYDLRAVAGQIKTRLNEVLDELDTYAPEQLIRQRLEKVRKWGTPEWME